MKKLVLLLVMLVGCLDEPYDNGACERGAGLDIALDHTRNSIDRMCGPFDQSYDLWATRMTIDTTFPGTRCVVCIYADQCGALWNFTNCGFDQYWCVNKDNPVCPQEFIDDPSLMYSNGDVNSPVWY